MKRMAGYGVALVGGWMVLSAAAQQSPAPAKPASNPPPAKAQAEPMSFWTKRQILGAQQGFEKRVDIMEQTLADSRKEQQRLVKETSAMLTQVDSLQVNLKTLLSRLNQAEQKAGDLEAQMPALKAELERQAQMVKAVNNPANGSAGQSGSDSRLAEVEKRIREKELLLQQKEKEIEELRKNLAVRDANLKKSAASVEKPADSEKIPAGASVVIMTPSSTGQQAAVIAPAKSASPASVPVPAVAPTTGLLTRHINEGNKALREGRVTDAEESFTAALAIDSTALDARMGWAACKYMNGQLPEAKTALDAVLKVEPNNSQALGLKGIIAWRENDLPVASSALNRAIRYDPNDAQLHNYLGIVLHSQGFSGDAVKELNKAIQLNPSLTDAHYNLAVVLSSLRKPRMDEARKSYQNALRLGYPRDEKLEQILSAQ